MPAYICLSKYTQKGLADIRNAPERFKGTGPLAESMGIRSIGTWVTMGEYDMVSIVEAPDDLTMAAFILTVAGTGNVTTQTMVAFSIDQLAQIVSRLPQIPT